MIYVSHALHGYKHVSTLAPWFRSTAYLEIDLQNFYEFIYNIFFNIRPLGVSKMYVDIVLRSLNIYVCWLWIYVCLSKTSCLLNISTRWLEYQMFD